MSLYIKNDTILEEDFLNIAESGDILLFSTDNFAAKMQRGLTRSKFDHVALVVRFDNLQLRVFDSSGDCGVSLTTWKDFILVNDLYRK